MLKYLGSHGIVGRVQKREHRRIARKIIDRELSMMAKKSPSNQRHRGSSMPDTTKLSRCSDDRRFGMDHRRCLPFRVLCRVGLSAAHVSKIQ